MNSMTIIKSFLHSHSFFTTLRYVKDLDGHEVPVDHNGKNAIYVGKIVLKVGKK